jgi:hypothetical protein
MSLGSCNKRTRDTLAIAIQCAPLRELRGARQSQRRPTPLGRGAYSIGEFPAGFARHASTVGAVLWSTAHSSANGPTTWATLPGLARTRACGRPAACSAGRRKGGPVKRLGTMAGKSKIFISYDTREKEWAIFLKDVFDARFRDSPAFVAIVDIRPREPGTDKIFKALRRAEVVVPICSHLSRTSPWLWWEAASAWARKKKALPIFLGIAGNEFGGPLGLVAQGRDFDADGVDDLLREIGGLLPSSKGLQLTKKERARLGAIFQHRAMGPLRVDTQGPSHFQGETMATTCVVFAFPMRARQRSKESRS